MTTNRAIENKHRTHAVSGPGGMSCYCCRNYKPKSKAKTLNARALRRAMKIALKEAK